MAYREASAYTSLRVTVEPNGQIRRKRKSFKGLKIVAVALLVLWSCGCAQTPPRRFGEHRVRIEDRARVGEAMISVTDVAFREGKGRACLFVGGAKFKETTTSAFREALFFEGMSGDIINMSHREYRKDLDKPFFVTPLRVDLKKSAVFWFLDFRIQVLEATDEDIRFEEIGSPIRDVTGQTRSPIINIDARTNDSLHPVSVVLAAGTYKIAPLSISDGGGHNAWTSQEHGGAWFHRYCVESDEFFFCEGKTGGVPSARMAFEGARNRMFALSESQYVQFYIKDETHVDANGGVSLRLEPVFAPEITIFKLSPVQGLFGTRMTIRGSGFGRQKTGMMEVTEGYYSFVSLRRDDDSKAAVVTKYPFWSDEEIEVILDDLFFDENGDSLHSGSEVLLDADGLVLGKYHVRVHTLWFHDDDNNNIYDGRYERHCSFSSNSQVFELIGVAPVADAGPDISILVAYQKETFVGGTVFDSAGKTLSCRWLGGEDELSGWNAVDQYGECLLDLNRNSERIPRSLLRG
jgi:hypothetical protein